MTADRVRELARELHAELERDDALDADARAALDELRDDVDRALEGEPERAPSARARTVVEQFEADHPDLTALVQRLADALSAIGL
ncbi:MAG: DUF4404 family protein [Sandaracinaceae bacterium]|nr:DUF4404 family protein [Sandaracinaceae bacterium]